VEFQDYPYLPDGCIDHIGIHSVHGRYRERSLLVPLGGWNDWRFGDVRHRNLHLLAYLYTEKIAVVKVLTEILKADNNAHEKEIEYLNDVISSFGLEEKYKSEADSLVTLQALSTIREMIVDKKAMVAQMMGRMIVIDKDINYNEVKLYNAFCESCDIEKDFNVQDYPDYTLSGPFVNPEDLMDIV
jgi:uncharacterized tellurite resistance protein B-like protein